VEPIRKHLTTDHVVVQDEYSDTQLAELFLHHRVLIIPIATEGRVHAVVTRHDFFEGLVTRLAERVDG
jgi:predicted transcriptional regulator